MKPYVPIKFEDLDFSDEDTKYIADGARKYLPPVADVDDNDFSPVDGGTKPATS